MSRLDDYVREHGDSEIVDVKELQVEPSPHIEALLNLYEEWLSHNQLQTYCVEERIANLDYTAEDVQNFLIHLHPYEDEEGFSLTGYFLSQLIYHGNDSSYGLDTTSFAKTIDFIGHRNTKDVIVRGSAGNYVGSNMNGGSILIEGSVGIGLGIRMSGGKINVRGNAGEDVGYNSWGGSIKIGGKIGNVGSYALCRITQRRIIPRGLPSRIRGIA